MMSFRKILFWLHLTIGCVSGLLILLMSVTGVLLTYERQTVSWIERRPLRQALSAHQTDQKPLPLESLVSAVSREESLPAAASFVLRPSAIEPVEISLGRDGVIYADPYDGRVLSHGSPAARAFFREVTAWHRWLGQSPRSFARSFTGASNLLFLGLIVSGFYLWLPRVWTKTSVAAVTWFRAGLRGRARDFNWHNTFGFWMTIPLFLIVLTAVPMSYGWANDLLYRMTGSDVPRPGRAEDGAPRDRRLQPRNWHGVDNAIASPLGQSSPWRAITVRLQGGAESPFSIAIDEGTGGQPQLRRTLTVGRVDGQILKQETFSSNNLGRRLRTWARFVHTGEAFGMWGQTFAGLASLAACVLVWTGISLALRRLFNSRNRRDGRPVDKRSALAA